MIEDACIDQEEDEEQFAMDFTGNPKSDLKIPETGGTKKTYSLGKRVSPLFLHDEYSPVSSSKMSFKIHGPYWRSTEVFDDLPLSPPGNCSSSDGSSGPNSSSVPNTSCIPVGLSTTVANPKWKRYGDLKIHIDLFNKGILIIEPCSYFMSTSLDSPTLSYLRDSFDLSTNLRKICLNQKAEIMSQACDRSSFDVNKRKLLFTQKATIIRNGGKASASLRKTISLLDKFKEYVNITPIIECVKECLQKNRVDFTAVDFQQVEQLKILYANNKIELKTAKKTLSLYIKYLELLRTGSTVFEENFLRQAIVEPTVSLMSNLLGREIKLDELKEYTNITKIIEHVKEYLQKNSIDFTEELAKISKKYNTTIDKLTETQLREIDLQQLTFVEQFSKKIKLLDVKKTMSLYIKYLKLFNYLSSVSEEKFFKQLFQVLLRDSLAEELNVTCAIDEEQTDIILVARDCALRSFEMIGLDTDNFIIHDQKLWDNFKQVFWEHYVGVKQCFNEENGFVITNQQRREEVFCPFVVRNKPQDCGVYFYPWLSTNNLSSQTFNFSGVKRFVTAGCMFGSTLKGIDQNGARLDLIKHDIKFHDAQKIMTIEYSPSNNNAYEEVMFNELEKLMLVINCLSNKDGAVELYYHLPYYDYMLFGIELYIRGRMQLLALENFFKAIVLKTVDHVAKIKEICERYSINCRIRSPFENLFGRLPISFKDIAEIIRSNNDSEAITINIVEVILPMLGESISESNPELNDQLQEQAEERLVQCCLEKLQKNTMERARHSEVWIDYINYIWKQNNKTIEENAKIIGPEAKEIKQDLCKINEVPEDITQSEKKIKQNAEIFKQSAKIIEQNAKITAQNAKIIKQYALKSGQDPQMIEQDQKVIERLKLGKLGKVYKNNLDGLFEYANAVMVLLASQGEADYKVCSLLPFSEKQIQVSYANFCNSNVNYAVSNADPVDVVKFKYPTVINLTTTDPVIAYDHNKKGLLFYFGSCQDSLSKLMKQDILGYAHQNVALTAENKESINIEQLLESLESCKLTVT